MPDLTKEQYDGLPDYVKEDYTEVEGVYKHAGMMTVKKTADNLDTQLKAVKSENAQLSERMTKFEADQAAAIEEAKKEALKNAKTNNDVEEIERIHAEQMADLETRVTERVRNDTLSEVKKERAEDNAKSISSRVSASMAVDEDAEAVLNELLSKRVQPNDNGDIVFLNEDGSASTLDEKGFIEEVKKSNRYKRLLKANPNTTGGGFSNGGGNSGGSTPEGNKAAEEAKKKGDLHGFLKASIKLPNM